MERTRGYSAKERGRLEREALEDQTEWIQRGHREKHGAFQTGGWSHLGSSSPADLSAECSWWSEGANATWSSLHTEPCPNSLPTETWTIINGCCFKPLRFGWFVIQQHITDKLYPNLLFLFLRNGRSQGWAFYLDSETCERPGLTRSVSTYLHVPNKGDLTSLKATALTPKYYQWISLEDVVIGNCLHFSIFLELAKIASIMGADMP